jgi:hypothetical protein
MKKENQRKLELNKKLVANLTPLSRDEEGKLKGGEDDPSTGAKCTCCNCTHHCLE